MDRMPPSDHSGEAQFGRLLVDLFKKAGWKVRRQVSDTRADIFADAGDRQYLVELKSLSEGRRDRLIPLLAKAILEVRSAAELCPSPVTPVAVVASARVPVSVAEAAQSFAEVHAPDVGVGVIDGQGLRVFSGYGLERFNEKRSRRAANEVASHQKLPNLFSDLNQWMLKILVGQALPQSLLNVPRAQCRNASQLAAAASVSVMSAFRLVQRLTDEGFLGEEQDQLKVVRVEELLERWVSANRQTSREIPARWTIKKDVEQLYESLAEYMREFDAPSNSRKRRSAPVKPRCCLGLFAAADLLGFGFVRGVQPHIYLESLEPDVLQRFRLAVDDSAGPPDVYLRIPTARESVFRATTKADGVPVSDIVQIWLDVCSHPARGREQADLIRTRALGPLFTN